MVVLSLEFTLIEAVRIRGIKQRVESVSLQITESVLSEYNAYLWKNYGVLMMDGDYGSLAEGVRWDVSQVRDRAYDFAERNTESNFYRMSCEDIEIKKYGVITDQEGQAFIKQGAIAMETEIATSALKEWKQQVLTAQQDQSKNIDMEELLIQGEEAVQQAKKEAEDSQDEPSAPAPTGTQNSIEVTNPIKIMKEWKDNGILSAVLKDVSDLSDVAMDITQVVSRRELTQGTLQDLSQEQVYETLLYEQYLLRHFQSYVNPMGHEGMAYELEYILCGKESDKANLEAVVERLVGMREVENYSAILLDEKKKAQALAMATSLAGASGNPAVIKAVELGVIAAWALMESILDVRLLLTGGKVPFIKTATEWTSDLYQLTNYLDVNVTAKECEGGLGYDHYMMALLFLLPHKQLGLRPMDLMEYGLHQQEDYVNVRMDHMIYAAELEYCYQSEPIFFSFIPNMQQHTIYHFKQIRELSYLS